MCWIIWIRFCNANSSGFLVIIYCFLCLLASARAEPDPAALMTRPETTSHSQDAPTTSGKEQNGTCLIKALFYAWGLKITPVLTEWCQQAVLHTYDTAGTINTMRTFSVHAWTFSNAHACTHVYMGFHTRSKWLTQQLQRWIHTQIIFVYVFW